MGGTAENIQAWSTTAASNSGADSTIGTLANSSAPNSVDDWLRSVMASIAKYADDTGGALIAGGTSTALTVTTGQSIVVGHIANGYTIVVRTASAATGPATIAIDGLSAVDIKTNAIAAISSGDWASGAILILVYSSTATAFIAANVGPQASLDINSITTYTAVDHAADFVPLYDTSASANRKALPRYLAPSVRASFSAHKNASNQSISSSAATKVTFGTEVFDVGSAFASSTWTPPAGTCLITACVGIASGLASGNGVSTTVYKNGGAYKQSTGTMESAAGVGAISVSFVDQCNGTDTYEVYVTCAIDSSYVVSGATNATFFTGTMI
jgi:hypothetical protein